MQTQTVQRSAVLAQLQQPPSPTEGAQLTTSFEKLPDQQRFRVLERGGVLGQVLYLKLNDRAAVRLDPDTGDYADPPIRWKNPGDIVRQA